jgi:hypothetical protein
MTSLEFLLMWCVIALCSYSLYRYLLHEIRVAPGAFNTVVGGSIAGIVFAIVAGIVFIACNPIMQENVLPGLFKWGILLCWAILWGGATLLVRITDNEFLSTMLLVANLLTLSIMGISIASGVSIAFAIVSVVSLIFCMMTLTKTFYENI